MMFDAYDFIRKRDETVNCMKTENRPSPVFQLLYTSTSSLRSSSTIRWFESGLPMKAKESVTAESGPATVYLSN